MHGQEPLFTRQTLKSPAVVVFASLYILALILALRQNARQAFVYAAPSMGLLFLIWLIVELTRTQSVPAIQIHQSALETRPETPTFAKGHIGGKWGNHFSQNWQKANICRCSVQY